MTRTIRVGAGRIISMRYAMKNSDGDVLTENTVSFLYGSGEIMPELETPLIGLKPGEQTSFTLSPQDTAQLNETFHFDVIIDDVRWKSNIQEEATAEHKSECGPGCGC
jgi:FKBP-type peptidyl-prolyl cis-trans isomerase (trigger factor)